MMNSKQIREAARNALRGNWGIAVLAGLIASLLGAGGSGFSFNFNFNFEDADFGTEQVVHQLGQQGEQILQAMIPALIIGFVVGLAVSVVMMIIGSVVSVGYAKFNSDMVDGVKPTIGTMFSYFGQLKTAFCASLLVFIHVFIGTIFFVIPGIIAVYKYAMVYHVIADNPDISARDALRKSRLIMQGNKWRFFVLNLSFIGWNLLSILTLGLASLWVHPYMMAANAVFYEEVNIPDAYTW